MDLLVVYMCIFSLQRKYHVWVKISYSLSHVTLWALISSAVKPRTVESRQILMLPFMDVKNTII